MVIQENTEADGASVIVQQTAPSGANIRVAGIDFRRGEELLKAGTTVDARTLGLAAAMNCAELAVHRRPKVAIFATGDERWLRCDMGFTAVTAPQPAVAGRWSVEEVGRGDHLAAFRRLGLVPEDVC